MRRCCSKASAKNDLLDHAEVATLRCIAANIAKLPELLRSR
jgi:hypothetical protein